MPVAASGIMEQVFEAVVAESSPPSHPPCSLTPPLPRQPLLPPHSDLIPRFLETQSSNPFFFLFEAWSSPEAS